MAHVRVLASVAAAIVVAGSSNAHSQDDSAFRILDIESTTGIDLGRGFDILTGAPRADCVDRSLIEGHPEFGPNSVTFRSVRIENSRQLDKALGVSASASISMGVGSASASASYASTLSVSSYSLNYVVESAVRAKGSSIRDAQLKDRYKKLIAKGNTDSLARFRAICGDGFISELSMGGEFKAIIQVATNSRSESESLAASIGGSYGVASGAASFSSAIKKASENHEVRIWSFRRGGNGAVPITADDIAIHASNLPTAVRQAPTPVQIAVFSYLMVLDDPSLPLDDFAERSSQIDKLAALSARARDQMGDAQYILDHPSQFFSLPTDIPRLAQELKSLGDFRLLVKTKADECIICPSTGRVWATRRWL